MSHSLFYSYLGVKHLNQSVDFYYIYDIIRLFQREWRGEMIMNDEVLKAMQGNKKEHKVRKWWRKNGYKIMRVILFPLWIGDVLTNKFRAWLNSRQKWSEERATEILNYYVPRTSHWDEKEQSLYFFDNGMGWNYSLAKRYLKRKDRRFWKVHCQWWGGKMRTLLMEKFELEGFTKELGDCSEGWTEITFFLNEKTL